MATRKPARKSAKRSRRNNDEPQPRNNRNSRRRQQPRDEPEEYDNDLRGVLFPNERKKNVNQPDYTGSVTVDGAEFWLSGWGRKSKQGRKYMSLALTPKDVPDDDPDDFDEYDNANDDLPFR